MHNYRIASIGVTLLLAVGLLSACGSGGTKPSAASAGPKCPLHILLITDSSGSSSFSGQVNIAAAKAGVDEVNKTGGVLGCKLVLDTRDDDSNYTQDLPLLQSATSSYNYPLVMNPDVGASSTAPYISREKLLEIIADETGKTAEPSVPYPTIFETILPSARAMDAGVQYALGKGYKRLAVIVDNTTTGVDDIEGMTPLIKAAGGSITDTETVNEESVDFTSAVERAKASNPQALILDIFGPAAAHVLTEIHALGWNIPIIGGTDVAATPFQGLVPLAYLKNVVVSSQASEAYPSNAVTTKFIAQLQADGVTITGYLFGYSAQYDSELLFAWAANQTHSLNSLTIAAYLHDHGTTTVPGLIDSNTTGYTPTSGEWNGKVALMKEGFFNLGRLPLIKYITAPPLPAGL
jgi:branched-chain amino acid transport system substrate-binding protein